MYQPQLSNFRVQTVLAALFCALLSALSPTLFAEPLPGADGFERTLLVDNLANGVNFEITEDGRIFILNRYGEVRVYNPNTRQTNIALSLAGEVFYGSEAGLLGLAFDPNFTSNQIIYLYYSPLSVEENRLSSFVVTGDSIDKQSEKVILQIPAQRGQASHEAGNLEFDTQGNLYIGTGDASEHGNYAAVDEVNDYKSAERTSANTNDLRGKVLRIKPNGVAGTYSIPTGNLFPGGVGGRAEIYIMGARNPYKFGIDPVTNWLFWSDVGPDGDTPTTPTANDQARDEINLTQQAGNYGWPYFIGDNIPYDVRGVRMDPASPINDSIWNTGATDLPPAQGSWLEQPRASYMGGPVYRHDPNNTSTGKLPAQFDQHLFYWDFNQSILRYAGFDDDGNLVRDEQLAASLVNAGSGGTLGLIDVEIGPDDHLYYLEYGTGCCDLETGNGKLYRLDYTGTNSAATANQAKGKNATASSVEEGTDAANAEDLTPGQAVDGNPDTRWSSQATMPQWLRVDLGKATQIERLNIVWGDSAHASAYQIQLSSDDQDWITVHTETAGDGDLDAITLPQIQEARYVRIYATAIDFDWGISVRELEIYNPAPADNFSNPSFIDRHYQGSGTCSLCHNGLGKDSQGNKLSIVNSWSNSMMANSARDPYWRAKVAAEIHRNPHLEDVINDKCSRCHAPMANDTIVKAGRVEQDMKILDDGMLNPYNPYFDLAMDGVSCTLCHQIDDNGTLGTPEGNSGRFHVEAYPESQAADRPAYGQYTGPLIEEMKNSANYTPVYGAHMGESAMCATCHDLKTPFVDGAGHVLSSDYSSEFPEQMVFTEWQNSDFRVGGPKEQSCQDCHMPRVEEPVQIASKPSDAPTRDNFAQHSMIGVNTTMLAILRDHRNELGVMANDLSGEIERTQAFLKTAASLSIEQASISNNQLNATVKVNNHTGHKLPSAYPSRRAFIHFEVKNSQGEVIFESGKPNADGSITGHDTDQDSSTFEPHYDLITQADQVQVYEPILSDSDGQVTHTLLRAATYLKDNRLLPAGLDKTSAPDDIKIVGEANQDDNFTAGGDEVRYQIDVGNATDLSISATLYFQPLAYGHLQDLFESDELNEVAQFKAQFDATPHKTETIASATAKAQTQAANGGGGGGGGSLSFLLCLVPLLLLRWKKK